MVTVEATPEAGGWRCSVEVAEGGAISRHAVRMRGDDLERWSRPGRSCAASRSPTSPATSRSSTGRCAGEMPGPVLRVRHVHHGDGHGEGPPAPDLPALRAGVVRRVHRALRDNGLRRVAEAPARGAPELTPGAGRTLLTVRPGRTPA